MKKKVYLAGSMYNNPDPVSWRVAAAQMLPDDWEAIDPCKLECADMSPEEIVELDYGLIVQSQAIIARVSKPSWGTAMELGFAKFNRVPVFGWSHLPSGSPWLLAHTVSISLTLKEAILELRNV